MLDGLLVHADLETAGESAAPALVAVGLVYHAQPLPRPRLAPVLAAPPYGALEETSAAVTREDAVVLPRGEVPAHLARRVVQDAAARAAVARPVPGLGLDCVHCVHAGGRHSTVDL